MHCIMGKDEYDKSQGGFLPPISPEHAGESQSVPQGIATNHLSCGTQSDCKFSKMLVLNNGLPNELPLNPCDKQPESNGGCYQTELLKLPKSCPDFFQTLNDKPETSLQSELVSIGPEDSSDSEELGLTTHRPNVNADGFFDLVTGMTGRDFRHGYRQGRKDRTISSRKGDNFVKVQEEDTKRNTHTATNNFTNRKGNGRQRLENSKYNPIHSSPPQTHNNFVHVQQGEYEMDDVSVAYHQNHPRHLGNYEQYVVPPNFAYTADDIYRNAFSVGSYPNFMTQKKMLSFVNALVSPTFFTPSYSQQQELAHCQYYAAVNQQDVPLRHRQSAQQTPGGETYVTNTIQPQTPMGLTGFSSPSSASSYVDRLHPMDTLTSVGGDYSGQTPQLHLQQTNTPRVVGQENWLQNGGGEESCSSSLGTSGCCNNGKPIFRSRSFSAVEQSSREAELSVHADNYFSTMSPHHSSIGDMENRLHNLRLCHSKSDNQYHYPPNPCAKGNLQIRSEGLVTNKANLNDCVSCAENLPPGNSWQQDSRDQSCSTPFSWIPDRHVMTQSEFYEDDAGFVTDATDDNVFCQSGTEFNLPSSWPAWTLSMKSHKLACHPNGKSHSFSQAENSFSSGGNKLESYSDTEVYSKSPQSISLHKFQPSSEYEDVSHQDVPSTMQAVFAMDEDIFSSPDTNLHFPVPALNLADSSEFDNRQFGCFIDRDHQEQFQTTQVHEDSFARYPGTKYSCPKGPRKVRRKSGGGGAVDINRSVVSNNGHCSNLELRPVNSVPVYKRHWEKSSNIWGSYHCKDVNTFSSSLACQQQNKPKCKDVDGKHQGGSPSNHQRKEQRKQNQTCGGQVKNKKKNHPKKFSRTPTLPRCLKQDGTPQDSERPSSQKECNEIPCCDSADKENPLTTNAILGTSHEPSSALQPELKSQSVSESEIRWWQDGNVYPWHHLPDEIWLHIFSYLGNHDRFQCSLVSTQFHRIIQDESLWRHITLEKKMLQDDWLMRIAHLHPSTLELIQCHGDQVTAAGLSYLFKECTDSLLKLRFSRCSRGELTGDNILLASTVCRNLTHVDASWCTVTDSGLSAIAKSCDRLESLCLNGCGLIADNGLKTLATLHYKSLKELEMFGCFNVTSRGIRYLANICRNLRTLQLGQCYKITDSCIAEVSSNLCCVENLDLRGCKQIKDTCIEKIVDNCSRLQTLALANCPNISNNAMQKIASTLPGIRSIDVCGCKLITDESVNRLAMNCRQLVYLDISSTGCTYKSVCRLAEQGSTDLETLKLNFIAGITESSLTRLTNHCKRLTTLHLYGCKRVKNLQKLQALHPQLIIESDKD